MEVASSRGFIYTHESFHLLRSTSMEPNLPSSPMEVGSRPAAMEVTIASMEATNNFHVFPSTSLEVENRAASTAVAPA